MKKIVYIFILFFGSFINGYSQNSIYKNYNKTNALPSNVVYNIAFDSKGFLWLAHSKGLSRLSNNTINNYYSNSKQGSSVSNILFYNNTVYCQDFNGNFYYVKNDSLIAENNIKSSGTFYEAFIINDELVHFTNYSIGYYNAIKKKSLFVPCKSYIVNAAKANKNELFIICDSSCYTVKYKQIVAYSKRFNASHYAAQGSNNYYAVTKNISPYIFNAATNEPIKNNLPTNTFIQAISCVEDEIWICTSSGAYCYTKNLEEKYGGNCFFKGESISNVIRDNAGAYWFSSINNGLFYVPFSNVQLLFNNNSFTCINSTNNQLLAGTNSNQLIDINSNKIYQSSNSHSLDNLFILNSKTFANSDGFYEYNNGLFNKISTLAVKDVCAFNNNYLLATSTGLYVMANDKQSIANSITTLPVEKNIYRVTSVAKRCKAVYYNKANNTIYVSTVDGLETLCNQEKSKIFCNNATVFINQFYEHNNCVYANSLSNGFFVLQQNKLLPLKNFIHKNVVAAHFFNNQIWYISNGQLYNYNIATAQTTSHFYINNILNADLRSLTIYKNKLYIASDKGIITVDINSMQQPQQQPTLLFDKMLVNEKLVDYANNISLTTANNNVVFKFCCNAYSANDSLKYLYKINNQNWIQLNSKNELALNELGSGKYHILLKTLNEKNIESKNILEWNIEIETPFYKRWWFVALVFASTIALIVLYYQTVLHKKEATNKLMAEKLRLEEELKHSLMASIKSQMNPHFLFNALNTIQSYIYTNDKQNATLYLSKFSQLTRNILDQSNNDFITLSEEIETLKLYVNLETMRFEDKLTSQFIVEENVDEENVIIPSMLIQPYVENAIKHGLLHKKENRILTISFVKKGDILQIIIDDNGVGRKQSELINAKRNAQHKSFALTANKKRLDILKDQDQNNIAFEIIDNYNEQGSAIGTTVVLSLPYQLKRNGN